MTQKYLVQTVWDPEAKVWFASSDDVPGLVTEADTIEALKAKLQTMVPEILAINGHLPTGDRIQFDGIIATWISLPSP